MAFCIGLITDGPCFFVFVDICVGGRCLHRLTLIRKAPHIINLGTSELYPSLPASSGYSLAREIHIPSL